MPQVQPKKFFNLPRIQRGHKRSILLMIEKLMLCIHQNKAAPISITRKFPGSPSMTCLHQLNCIISAIQEQQSYYHFSIKRMPAVLAFLLLCFFFLFVCFLFFFFFFSEAVIALSSLLLHFFFVFCFFFFFVQKLQLLYLPFFFTMFVLHCIY